MMSPRELIGTHRSWGITERLLMTPDDVPHDACWYGLMIPHYRSAPGNSTWARYEYDSLPSVRSRFLDGTYGWLDDWVAEQPHLADGSYTNGYAGYFSAALKPLQTQAQRLGLKIPDEFIRFFMDARLWRAVPSENYWRLPDQIVVAPNVTEQFLIMFHSDGQDGRFWYLYLDRSTGKHCVVTSMDCFGIDGEETPENESAVEFCAQTFAEYLFRIWVECSSWDRINQGLPLDPIQQQYLNHYLPNQQK
ncbi:MAG: hypothetical protein R3C18_01180 [Planctomycetaceae bacterium]